MAMHDRDRDLRLVEDSTYQRRAGRSDIEDPRIRKRIEWFRQKLRDRRYAEIIKIASRIRKNSRVFPYSCIALSLSLAAVGRHVDGVGPALLGLQEAFKRGWERSNPGPVAKLFNSLACRVFQVLSDDVAAEHFATRGWTLGKWRTKGVDAWNNVVVLCEMKLHRARTGRASVDETIREINTWMTELVDNFPSYETNPDLIAYVHRSIGLREWRSHKSSLFKKLFGHTRPE